MVPGVGGNVLGFAQFANLLGPDQPFYGTQSRGLDGKGEPLRTVEEMARQYIQEMQEVQPSGPYTIGGACMGGVVAFEMARQLESSGENVALLAMVETWLPRSLQPRRFRLHRSVAPAFIIWRGILRHLTALAATSPREWPSKISKMIGIAAEMIVKRDPYRGDRSVLYQDAVSAANYEAMARYVPSSYSGHIHLFLASDRPVDPTSDTRLEWTRLAEGGFSVHRINAKDSGQLMVSPHVENFAKKFAELLDGLEQAGPRHTASLDGSGNSL
jgi:thioesterase domain-containing protein